MTHKQNLVVVIKARGKVLRESDGSVLLPFGCEYAVLVKNLDSVRMQVKVSVDGTDATEGTRLIIPPNSDLELERFIRNGNMDSGNRFKFIERTAEIEEHRGIKADDGLVRVEAWREHIQKVVDVPIRRYYDEWHPRQPIRPPYPPPRLPRPAMCGGRDRRTSASERRPSASAGFSRQSRGRADLPVEDSLDSGITVPGSRSNQAFHWTPDFPVEPQSIVLTLQLRGYVGELPVSQPITVDQKPTCSTCGRTNKGDAEFCSKCGTALVLV